MKAVQDAHGFVYDYANFLWVPMRGGANGSLVVAGSAGTAPTQGVVGPTATFASMQDALCIAQFNSPDIVLAAGQVAVLQGTSAGFVRIAEQFSPGAEDNTNAILATVPKPLATSTYTATATTSLGAANAGNLKASSGNLFSFSAQNTNALTRWLFFCNTAGTPTGATAAAIIPFMLPSNSQVTIGEDFFGQTGINFATGIAFAFMTTLAGGTLGTAGECFLTARTK